MTKVINNQNRLALRVNSLHLHGVTAVGDDGSVCIEVKGDAEYTKQVAQIIHDKLSDVTEVGDGVQNGDLWINNYQLNIHDDVYNVAHGLN